MPFCNTNHQPPTGDRKMTWQAWESVTGFEFKDILYEKRTRNAGGRVGRITFNRPQVRNAFTDYTVKELVRAFDDSSNDPMIGVVVLTGAGDEAFCAGGDIKWEGERSRAQFFMDEPLNRMLRFCRKPVIAAIKGWAIGGGHHLAYMCDLSIAAENAKFGQNGPIVGSPADGYIVRYLVSVVGAKKAREIWMTCRRYNAQEALEMGLVNAVVPLTEFDAEVDKWCNEILGNSPEGFEII